MATKKTVKKKAPAKKAVVKKAIEKKAPVKKAVAKKAAAKKAVATLDQLEASFPGVKAIHTASLAAGNPKGCCRVAGNPIPNITKAACDQIKGIWNQGSC